MSTSRPPSPSAASSASVDANVNVVHGALAYPASPREELRETIHGVAVDDPYRWLEDAKAPRVKAWMAAQDALARTTLSAIPEKAGLVEKLTRFAYGASEQPPSRHGKRYFTSRRGAKDEKFSYWMREGKTGKEQLVLDPSALSKDGSVSVHAVSISQDGSKFAYGKSENNADDATLYVRDVTSGKDSTIDVIPGARYAYASWTPKGDGFYYVGLPTDPSIPVDLLPGYSEVRYHSLGTDPKADPIVRAHLGDPSRYFDIDLSRDGHFLTLRIERGRSQHDVFVQDMRVNGPHEWKPLVTGVEANFAINVYKDKFYVRTNDGAARYHVYVVDPAKMDRASWKEIVPERKDATLKFIDIVGGRLSMVYSKDALEELELHELDGKLVRKVALPGVGGVAGMFGLPEDDEAYYSFESYSTPPQIFQTSIKVGTSKLYWKREIPVDTSKYEVEARFATSKDGTKVPYFVTRPKDLVKDGKAVTLITGYGGFAISTSPTFNPMRMAFLESGGIMVTTALRGGDEYGKPWHEAGMRGHKQNVFDDFFAVAEDLIATGVTSPPHLGIFGGSNGGLLMGAAITQRPELFGAVVCAVPLLDMIRYTKLGAGKTWIDEYGTADNAADFPALLAYSPYHHVRAGMKYPPLLLASADSDDRVDPFHARKFAAAMQAASNSPVLLRIEKNAGHGGGDMIQKSIEASADNYAFLLSHLK